MERVLDFHVHLPTASFISTLRPFVESINAYFRTNLVQRDVGEAIEELRGQGVTKAVLLPIDAHRLTGIRGDTNELMARIQDEHRDFFVCFATVDPHSPKAPEDLEDALTRLGLRGLKLHPQLQDLRPNDPKLYPVYAVAERHGVPVLVHTGTSGIGAGMPGGGSMRLDYGRPIHMDEVAAIFPRLNVILAHFGWPWHEEALAVALHKRNVYIDLSGWLPKYIPQTVLRYVDTLLRQKALFGSDYPMLSPSRCLEQFRASGLRPETLERVLYANGAELLGLT
ncbi:MAG: amidohydrolase family protein [Candidatus Caldarchaeales archaeon]